MRWLGLGLIVFSALATAADLGVVVRATELKSEPFTDASTLAQLAEKSELEVIQRQGAWYQVSSPQSGWVRMLSIRLKGTAIKGESGVAAVIERAYGIRPEVTVATGVRGLSDEDIKNAKPNEEELHKLDAYSITKTEAHLFAKSTSLKPEEVGYRDASGALIVTQTEQKAP